jgi:hypothetical protein
MADDAPPVGLAVPDALAVPEVDAGLFVLAVAAVGGRLVAAGAAVGPPMGAVEAPLICAWTSGENWPDMPVKLKKVAKV